MNYNGLWKLLIDRKMNKGDLQKKAGISSATIAKMSNNQFVSMETIVKICNVLECEISDIVAIEIKETEK